MDRRAREHEVAAFVRRHGRIPAITVLPAETYDGAYGQYWGHVRAEIGEYDGTIQVVPIQPAHKDWSTRRQARDAARRIADRAGAVYVSRPGPLSARACRDVVGWIASTQNLAAVMVWVLRRVQAGQSGALEDRVREICRGREWSDLSDGERRAVIACFVRPDE